MSGFEYVKIIVFQARLMYGIHPELTTVRDVWHCAHLLKNLQQMRLKPRIEIDGNFVDFVYFL